MRKITITVFFEALKANGIDYSISRDYWRDQLDKWNSGYRGPDMHDNALSTLAELESR